MDQDKSKILSREERDSFTGTTIDENGNAHDYNDSQRDVFRDRVERESAEGGPRFRHFTVHSTSGCGVWAFALLIIAALFLGMFVFVLPYYLVGILVCGILGWLFNSF